MMRSLVVISVLVFVAGCSEHRGWNPSYRFGGASSYGEYQREREAILVSGNGPVRPVPVALPTKAPGPAEISGKSPVPVPSTRGVTTTRQTARPAGSPASTANAALPVTTEGRYPGSTPVLVRYAHEENPQPGKSAHTRAGGSTEQATRICAGYTDVNAAQTAFLASGGPQRDPLGMDPDGDGIVCGWDPAPFRNPQP